MNNITIRALDGSCLKDQSSPIVYYLIHGSRVIIAARPTRPSDRRRQGSATGAW